MKTQRYLVRMDCHAKGRRNIEVKFRRVVAHGDTASAIAAAIEWAKGKGYHVRNPSRLVAVPEGEPCTKIDTTAAAIVTKGIYPRWWFSNLSEYYVRMSEFGTAFADMHVGRGAPMQQRTQAFEFGARYFMDNVRRPV